MKGIRLLEINYSLANSILEETYIELERISRKADINKIYYKKMYDIIEKSTLNLNAILNETDVVNEIYCKIENIIIFLEDKKKELMGLL